MKKGANKGLTLIEMIMVLGISAILLAMAGLSYNLINNSNVQKSARRLENVIRLARTRSMAKGTASGRLVLYEQNGNIYARIGDDTTPELICNSGVTMEAIVTAADYTVRSGGSSIPAYSTDPSAQISINFSTAGTGQTFNNSYNKFLLHRGKRSFEVIVYKETGSVETNMYVN